MEQIVTKGYHKIEVEDKAGRGGVHESSLSSWTEVRWAGRSGPSLSSDSVSKNQGKSTPAAGLSIYVDYLMIASDAAITLSLGEREGTPGSPDAVLLGPIPFAVNQCLQWTFLNGGMKLTAAKSLVVDSSGAGNINVFLSGRVE